MRLWIAAAILCGAARAAAAPPTLSNPVVSARFDDRGLVAIVDSDVGTSSFVHDDFSVVVDGSRFESASLSLPRVTSSGDRVTFSWSAGTFGIDVTYELHQDWRFVSKQLAIRSSRAASYRVDEITVFRAELAAPIEDVFVPKSATRTLGTRDYGGFLRFGGRGLLATVQNPFLDFSRDRQAFSVRYRPDVDWRSADGPFLSDRGLLAPYRLTGRRIAATMTPEWKIAAAPPDDGADEAEIEAFTNAVRAFLLHRPARPLNVFVGWCANDYQIDAGTAEGRAEYKRVIDRAAELGAEYVLYAPSNSELSRREESVDDWSWEHVLWLGLGQRMRKGEWDPARDPIPDSIREMVDYAAGKRVRLLAYVYPVLPFAGNPDWLVTDRGRQYASLGNRSWQDRLIDILIAFHNRSGIGGYSFDHTFLNYPGTSSYAQWSGWRRVVEELRNRVPDIVIDGRQAFHLYGPWSWLAVSYPHPTFNDEQPESFTPFPDLHFDRVSADRERYTAYRYRNYEFAPSEIVPGFMTHQTPRLDDTGEMPSARTPDRGVVLTPFRVRDWDALGWRYSLLSSIAIAGWNNVIDMIPARDLAEYASFSEEDKRWFRDWLAWADTNKEYLRHTRTILGPPGIGKVDGTSAIIGNRGYVFLFNPNARRLVAEFSLDASIGVGSAVAVGSVAGATAAGSAPGSAAGSGWGQFGVGPAPDPGPIRIGSAPDVQPTRVRPVPDMSPTGVRLVPDVSPTRVRLVPDVSPTRVRLVPDVSLTRVRPTSETELTPLLLREVYPLEGRLIGKPGAGIWTAGDRVSIAVDGQSAVVLELSPATDVRPLMFGAPGSVTMRDGGIVDVTSVHGEVGTSTDIFVLMPAHKSAAVLHVNGRPASFSRTPAGLRTTVTFAGTEFHHAQQVGPVNSSFVGGRFSATLTVPSWVFEQLRARARRISIPWTDEDLRTTWLAPARLLLYVPIAEPDDDRLDGRLAIDGHGIALPRAYTAIRPDKSTFTGFYADVSQLTPDTPHRIELFLPQLKPGQFQGVFLDNIEPQHTGELRR